MFASNVFTVNVDIIEFRDPEHRVDAVHDCGVPVETLSDGSSSCNVIRENRDVSD